MPRLRAGADPALAPIELVALVRQPVAAMARIDERFLRVTGRGQATAARGRPFERWRRPVGVLSIRARPISDIRRTELGAPKRPVAAPCKLPS